MSRLDIARARSHLASQSPQEVIATLQKSLMREQELGRPAGINRHHMPSPDIGHGSTEVTYITPNNVQSVSQGLDERGRPIDR